MPLHDWKRVDAGIFHAFHHSWIEEIHRALLKRLPTDYYSLPEQIAAGVGPDILALKSGDQNDSDGGGLATKTRPKTKLYQETETEFYLNKQKAVVIRHISGDRVVAVIEIVSPGKQEFRSWTSQLCDRGTRAFAAEDSHAHCRPNSGQQSESLWASRRHH